MDNTFVVPILNIFFIVSLYLILFQVIETKFHLLCAVDMNLFYTNRYMPIVIN